jgi:penicillin-binding protein 2
VGKTGTAQVASLENVKTKGLAHLKDHSWFVFYAPRENPEIAGVIFVEHGGWGATASTPIARYVLETYFAKRDGRPLPTVRVGGDGVLDTVPAPPPAPAGAPVTSAAAASLTRADPAR